VADEDARIGALGMMWDVIEFLIRTRNDHEWPAMPTDRMAQVLTPAGWDCVVVSGWADHRLRGGDTEISFSGEPVGWQVSIEDSAPGHRPATNRAG
jgi:hypothetical protein